MAYDASLASNAESWLIATIGGISAVGTGNVTAWPGVSTLEKGVEVVDELRAGRSPWVAVMFEGFDPRQAEEGVQHFTLIFSVWLVVQNERIDGAARVGEAGPPIIAGTNLLTEKIINAVDNPATLPTAGGVLAADHVAVQPGRSITLSRGVSIVQIKVNVLAAKKDV